jgi:hypothetical protein
LSQIGHKIVKEGEEKKNKEKQTYTGSILTCLTQYLGKDRTKLWKRFWSDTKVLFVLSKKQNLRQERNRRGRGGEGKGGRRGEDGKEEGKGGE